MTLDEFNQLPVLTSMFFEYSLTLEPNLRSPVIVHESASVVISAWEAVRYKFKFFQVNKVSWHACSFYFIPTMTSASPSREPS